MQLCDFRHVRRFLTHDASVLVANVLVSSQLEYCNPFFQESLKFNLCKLHVSASKMVQLESYQIPVDVLV